jgi:biotin operon repressor
MNTEEKIIDTLKASEKPMSAGQIADSSSIDRKEIDKAMKVLKENGTIVSPRRCYWTIS